MFLSQLFRRFARKAAAKNHPRRPAPRRLRVEGLEDRRLLAILYVDNTPTDNAAPNTDIFTPVGGTQAVTGGLEVGVNLFTTIAAAVAAASTPDTINVADGTYTETVTVPAGKTLTIRGNQFGVDARTRTAVPETIMNSTSGSFSIGSNDTIIDGITAQGQTGGPIGGSMHMQPTTNGIEIRNNIIQNNVLGIFAGNNSAGNQAVIEKNLFQNNTNAGAASGHGVYADQFTSGVGMQNILIDNNRFTNTALVVNSWALGLSNTDPTSFKNITFSNNDVTNHGRGMYAFNTDGLNVLSNNISGTSNYAIGIFTNAGPDGNANVDINSNILSANNRGIFVDGLIGTLDAHFNSITGSVLAAIQNDDVTSTVEASGNWWGTAVGASPAATTNAQFATIDPLLVGPGTISVNSILSSGTDATPAAPGLQLPAATELWVPRKAATMGTTRVNGVIQNTINLALTGMTIRAANETYVENLVVNKTVNLLGAQAGVDARAPRGAESIVDGNSADATFAIGAGVDDVVIDGFTIRGGANGLNAGVHITGTSAGYDIKNNIITDNAIGVYANSDGAAQIRQNLFDGNNEPGPAGGAGIYNDQGTLDLEITDNDFFNHTLNNPVIIVATLATANTNLVFSGNELDNDFGVYALKVINGTFEDNDILTDAATALHVGAGSSNVQVLDNDLSGNARGLRLVDFNDFGSPLPILGVTASLNTITGNDTGILIGPNASISILDNDISANNVVGIDVDGGVALIEDNNLALNGIGIRIKNSGLVDAGSIEADGSADPTNLNTGSDTDGSSTGENLLNGYTGVSGNYAIEDLNLDAGSPPNVNVEAENNNFGINNVEQVVFHTVDQASRTLVDFSPFVSATSIIDDGDAGFTTTFNWVTFANQGFQNDVTYAPAGAGGEVATWTFTDLLPGQYRVSATWHFQANRATDSPFTVSDNGNALATVLINQELAPNDFTSDGATWEDLGGPYNITSGTVVVRLTDLANEFVIADAIRIERIGELVPTPVLLVIDDGDAAFTTTAGWTSFPNQGFQSDIHYAASGTGSEVATWTFTGLSTGQYRVSATWHQQGNRATNSPFTVLDGANPLATVLRNQELAPNDFSDGGAAWEDLGGPYNITSGAVVVRLTNAANEFVIADAIRIERIGDLAPPAVVFVKDDGDVNFTTTAGWTSFPGQGFQNDVTYAASGGGSEVATWTFTGLPVGNYRVSATWSTQPNRATNSPFTVLDNATQVGAVTRNQELAPNDFTANGASWEDLGGPYAISSGTLVVRLSNLANEFVIADAIRIELL